MFNLLKSDIYRLVHGKMLWVSLALTALFVVGVAGLVWFATTPQFAQMVAEQAEHDQQNATTSDYRQDDSSLPAAETTAEGVTEPTPEATAGVDVRITDGSGANLTPEEVNTLNEKELPSRTNAYAQMLVTGGGLAMIVSLVTALFVASDFETGFAKNVFVGRGRRRAAYYLEKLVLCGVLSAVFLLAGMVLTDGAFALAGFEYRASETLGEYWGWVALAWLAMTMYAMTTGVMVLLTRSKAVGIVFALVVATGALASIVMTVTSVFAPAFPVLNDAVKWLPTSSVALLGSGGVGLLSSTEGTALAGLAVPAQVALVLGAAIAACVALAAAVGPRKDV
ncbi:ABC transporter permease subunit [Rubneribacter badeniensis]|uniref:ABC transporter permease subunit n=1 Tax=Rubneribacter badeniensis TaxID=2070688 RepID=UPI003A93E671